jgi:hypothetical protein
MHALSLAYRGAGSLACAMALWVAVPGCGGGSDAPDRPETVEVTGNVTYRGQPVEGATVTFKSKSTDGRGATGRTDEEGEFQLTTFEPGDGAIPGGYQVTVSKTVVEGELSEEEVNAYYEKGQQPPPKRTREMVPQKYKFPNTSPLDAEVTEDGDNEFTFDLTD